MKRRSVIAALGLILLCALPSLAQLNEHGSALYGAGGSGGASFPLTSPTANPAQSGQLRLANASDKVCWRNAANSGDLCIYFDGSNIFQIPGTVQATTFSGALSGNASTATNVSFSGLTSGTVPNAVSGIMGTGSSLDIGATGTSAYGINNANGFFQTQLLNDGTTGTTATYTACETSANPAAAIGCVANAKSHLIGVCVSGCGTSGYPKIAIRGNVASVTFDSSHAVVAGDWVVTSSTLGLVADTGSATYPTCGNQVVGVAAASGSASTAQNVLIRPDALPPCGVASQLWATTGTTGAGWTSSPTVSSTMTAAGFATPTTGVAGLLSLGQGTVPPLYASAETFFAPGTVTGFGRQYAAAAPGAASVDTWSAPSNGVLAFNATPTAGGSSYVQGDVGSLLTLSCGATVAITQVNSGAGTGGVTGIATTATTPGAACSTGTGQTTTGGTGTGATVNVTAVAPIITETLLAGAAAGDLAIYNGTSWAKFAGNNSGTKVLQETSAGVPSWVGVAVGTPFTSFTPGGTNSVAAGTPFYMNLGPGQSNSTSNAAYGLVPNTGTVSIPFCEVNTAPGTGHTTTFSIFTGTTIGGSTSASGATCVVSGTATTGTGANSAALTGGTTWVLQVAVSTSGTSTGGQGAGITLTNY